MANIWEKAISILAGNLNSGLSYLITTVMAACMANDYHNNMDLHCSHIGVALIIPHNLPKTSTVDFNDGK